MSDKEKAAVALAGVLGALGWLWVLACVKWGLVPVVEAFGGPTLPVTPTGLTLWFLWIMLIPFKINRK